MIKSSRKPLLSVGRATAKWGLVWAMPRFAPISACSSPPWNIPQGRGWCRRDTKLIDLHWTPQSFCHQGYSRKALRFHLQHLSVSSVYVKSHRKKHQIKPCGWCKMQTWESYIKWWTTTSPQLHARALQRTMRTVFLQTECVSTLRRNLHGLISRDCPKTSCGSLVLLKLTSNPPGWGIPSLFFCLL